MRPEYDIRGGVRGKYLAWYRAGRVSVAIRESPLIITISTGTPPAGAVTGAALDPPVYPGPRMEPGNEGR